MPRYIDAEKLAEHKFLSVTHERYVSDGWVKSEKEIYAYKVGYNEAIANIEQFAPTADVVEVVRCKDCTFWKTETEPIGIECEYGESAHYCDICGMMITRSNDFCSYGERREDGTKQD